MSKPKTNKPRLQAKAANENENAHLVARDHLERIGKCCNICPPRVTTTS